MATVLTQSPTSRPTPRGYKVDLSRGQRIGRVSSEWFSRPDDQRFAGVHHSSTARAKPDRTVGAAYSNRSHPDRSKG